MGKDKLTPEQQYQVVLEHLREGTPLVLLAKRYNISEQTIHTYKRKFLVGARECLIGQSTANKRALRRQNAYCSKLATRLLSELHQVSLMLDPEIK